MGKYYRHFKGGIYRCLAVAKDSETLKSVVVYQALYGDKLIWVRDYDIFFGSVNINGSTVKRFVEVDINNIPQELKK